MSFFAILEKLLGRSSVVHLSGRRTELNELFVNDFELKMSHSKTPHPGQASKHGHQSAPSLHQSDKPRADGLGFPLERTKNCSSAPPKQLETRLAESSLSRTEPTS